MEEQLVGEVSHYFNRIGVAAIALSETIQQGDKIHILGYTTDFSQEVVSLQIEHQAVELAAPGQDVALQVSERVRKGDRIYVTA